MTTTLPPLDQVQVATKATAHYLARLAAARAGGPQVDFTQGIVRVGDGNGAVPAISDLLTAGDVLHEVGTGSWVNAVNVNAEDPTQTDILVVIPTVSGGAEIGPFYVTEYAITDETGQICLVGTTLMAKFVSSTNGATSDIAFIASEKESNGNVILTPPSANFVTANDVELMINAHQPTATAPLTQTDTMNPQGWLSRVFGLRPSAKPAEPAAGAQVVDGGATGFGRPATDAEFAAGAGNGAAFNWPWPTLQQIKNALTNLVYGSGVGVTIKPDRTVNLDYAPLAATAPQLSDIFALLRPAVGGTPAAYFRTTIQALADLIRSLLPKSSWIEIADITFDGTQTYATVNLAALAPAGKFFRITVFLPGTGSATDVGIGLRCDYGDGAGPRSGAADYWNVWQMSVSHGTYYSDALNLAADWDGVADGYGFSMAYFTPGSATMMAQTRVVDVFARGVATSALDNGMITGAAAAAHGQAQSLTFLSVNSFAVGNGNPPAAGARIWVEVKQ